MLLASTRLIDTPVMSLQTGGQLARTKRAIIDPRSLTIIAYELAGTGLDETPSLLRIADVRELSNIGLIVDSNEEFVGVDDVIKLKEVYNFNFDIISKQVIDENGHKLGKVVDYSVEPGSFMIKQLNVRRPLLKSFSDTELIIDRTQIVEVTDSNVTIKHDEREPAPVQRAAQSFTNPFRGQNPQADASKRQSN